MQKMTSNAQCVLAEDTVEHVVRKLNAVCKAATFDFALAVGQVVIEAFYEGEIGRFRERGQHKDASLRNLAKHPDLPMSPAALYRSIAIYELCERLSIRSWKHVCTSHLRLVLPLSFEEQAHLLRLAEANRWTVRELDQRVAGLLRKGGSEQRGGGRPRQSPARKTISSVQRCVAVLDAIVAGEDEVRTVESSPESIRELVSVLQHAMEACETVRNRLQQMAPGAHTTPPPPLEPDGDSRANLLSAPMVPGACKAHS